jgi:hypothetical protein
VAIVRKFKVVPIDYPTDETISPEFVTSRDSFEFSMKWDSTIRGWMPISLYPLESVGGGRFNRQIVAVNSKGQVYFGE